MTKRRNFKNQSLGDRVYIQDESGSEDAAELESYLYSQIHYQQDSPEPENLDPSQSEETTDFISISENKV